MRIAGVLLIVLICVVGMRVIAPRSKPATPPRTTILDARLRILWAQMLKGSNTYYLPVGGNVSGHKGVASRLEGELRQKIRKLGFNIDTLPAFTPGKGPDGRAFLVCYAFPVPPTSSVHFAAELVAGDGTLLPLRSAAAGGGGPPEKSWDLWTLDALPSIATNYFLRLKQTNGTPVAEIRFDEP
jgi:hypothetical protein